MIGSRLHLTNHPSRVNTGLRHTTRFICAPLKDNGQRPTMAQQRLAEASGRGHLDSEFQKLHWQFGSPVSSSDPADAMTPRSLGEEGPATNTATTRLGEPTLLNCTAYAQWFRFPTDTRFADC